MMRRLPSRRRGTARAGCATRLRILVVFAHPDDESFGPAAILAKYARQGAQIFGLFFTRGQLGQTDRFPAPTPEELGRLRTQDLIDAAKIIGFRGIDVLDYLDGSLADVPLPRLESDILAAFHRFRPNLVITFGPAGITHHSDHLAIYRAATRAFARARNHGRAVVQLYYAAVPAERAAELGLTGLPDGMPNTFIEVAETLPIKIEALRAHARHVVDAREFIAQFDRSTEAEATLYRAWPPVPPGAIVTDFCQRPQPRGRQISA